MYVFIMHRKKEFGIDSLKTIMILCGSAEFTCSFFPLSQIVCTSVRLFFSFKNIISLLVLYF